MQAVASDSEYAEVIACVQHLLGAAGTDVICPIYRLRLRGGRAKASERVKHISDFQTIQDQRQLDAHTEIRAEGRIDAMFDSTTDTCMNYQPQNPLQCVHSDGARVRQARFLVHVNAGKVVYLC